MDERSYTSCIVYLNGDYWGVYDLREKVDDHDFTDYYYDQNKDNIQFLKTWGGTWVEYGGPQAQTDWDSLTNFIVSNSMSNSVNYNAVKDQLNTGSLIDYYLLNSLIVNGCWLNFDTRWWRGMDPSGDKKKWRYTLWDMDATFDHYVSYTSIPNGSFTADICDPSTLSNPGGQGHIPIFNALLNNDEFFADYINRWSDLSSHYFSSSYMVSLLDSMVAVIDPEMARQIATWGGTYSDWQTNVQDIRDFIIQRSAILPASFLSCYSGLSGPYNAQVNVVGDGEVEVSDGILVNNMNTSHSSLRF